jgi:hypothetical protein
MTRLLLTIPVLLATVATVLTLACSDPNHGVGDRCRTAGECDLPLTCSNRDLPDGSLGICVYPEALPDAALPQPDASIIPADAAPTSDASV